MALKPFRNLVTTGSTAPYTELCGGELGVVECQSVLMGWADSSALANWQEWAHLARVRPEHMIKLKATIAWGKQLPAFLNCSDGFTTAGNKFLRRQWACSHCDRDTGRVRLCGCNCSSWCFCCCRFCWFCCCCISSSLGYGFNSVHGMYTCDEGVELGV